MVCHLLSIPDIYFGEKAIHSLQRLDACKVGIVTDAFMVSSGKTQSLIEAMPRASVCIYADVRPDPDVEIVKAGAARFNDFKPDVIIALGGGSSLDAAKAIKVTLEELGSEIELIAIPTTSGSGSEATAYAVISDPENGRKYPLVTANILPDSAILDPQLVLSVPQEVATDTGMDVLTHAIEALVSTGANDFSDAFAEKAIALTVKYLPDVFYQEKNIKARIRMHHAACLAGMAFNSAGLGLVHGMAHAIGGMLHIPHGRINAMLLPKIIAYNCATQHPVITERYLRCAKIMGIDTDNDRHAVGELIDLIRDLNQQFAIPETLTEYGITRENICRLRQSVISAALADACTLSNPRTPTAQDIDRLLTEIS